MSTPDHLTVFPSYNARMLSAEDVGKLFVAPEQFRLLCQPDHSLVLGPRGSGKTTMLKMLTVPALKAWTNQAKITDFTLPFVGIYVPADQLWTRQLGARGPLEEVSEFDRLLARAAVATNVLSSFLDTLENVVKQPVDDDTELALAKLLAVDWQLPDAIPTFFGLRKALGLRMHTIRQLAA